MVAVSTGITIATLRSASELLASLLFTLAVTSRLVGVLGGVYRQGKGVHSGSACLLLSLSALVLLHAFSKPSAEDQKSLPIPRLSCHPPPHR